MSTSGTHWLPVTYSGRSLYDVIAPGGYRGFNVGRHAWKNLIPNSSLQNHCNRVGFNAKGRSDHSKARIGIISNQEGLLLSVSQSACLSVCQSVCLFLIINCNQFPWFTPVFLGFFNNYDILKEIFLVFIYMRYL